MSDNRTIENLSNEALWEYTIDRIAIIGEGTGNLLNVDERKFIVTCSHVAKQFFLYDKFSYVGLRKDVKILKENLKLIAITNDDLDIALIEITTEFNCRGFFTLEDFEIVENFKEYDFKNSNIILCGLLGSFAFKNELGLNYPFLLFSTIPHKNKSQTERFFYADYPKNNLINLQNNKPTTLPHPGGISGSFILKIKEFKGSTSGIWKPTDSKIIAIQQEWEKSKGYVKGTNIKYLIKLLKENNIT